MLTHFISPRFDHRKLEPPFYRDKVDVFEDRMRGWLLAPALKLLESDKFAIASMSLAINYFEGIEIFHSGKDSDGDSKAFFKRGFLRVFPLATETAAVQSRIIVDIYKLLRCGFAHDSMFRNGILFSTVRNEAILVTFEKIDGHFNPATPIESVVINPRRFVAAIEGHFTNYVRILRRADDLTLKENFEKAVALKWRLDEPGRVVGMSEEEFVRGVLPGGA